MSERWGPQKGHPNRHRGIALLTALVLIVVVVAGFGAIEIKKKFFGTGYADYSGPGTGSVIAHVDDGASASEIGDELALVGVVKSAGAFRKAAAKDPASIGIQPGYYKLRSDMKASLALALILTPSSRLRSKVTIPEGTSLARTLGLIAENATGVSLASLQAASKSPAALGLPSYADNHVEGFLFPATYDIEPSTSAVQVLTMMTQRFTQSDVVAGLVAGAKAEDLTPLQVVTLASIIEHESGSAADRGKVARVFLNRYRDGMTLGSEATVRYALGYPDRTLTQSDIEIDSPYNTYKYTGFPPGPIGNPGDAALQAAIDPTPGTWLYFFTRNDGTTVFSNTSAEFEASQQGNG